MSDRQTGSVWTHYDGTVLTGPLAGTGARMEILPTIHTTWEDWVSQYPDSLVTERVPEFMGAYRHVEPGRRGLGGEFIRTLSDLDDRLPENELVLGVNHGLGARAYVLADFDGPTVVNDELSGHPIVVFLDPERDFGLAYSRTLGGMTLEFEVVDNRFTSTDGTIWNDSGLAVSGPLAGSELTFLSSFVTEWYGWAAYNPDTDIHGR